MTDYADQTLIAEVLGLQDAAHLHKGYRVQVNEDQLVRLIAAARKRRPPARRAPTSARPVTPEMAAEIREAVRQNPHLPYADIARRFGVNPGRVSEVMNPAPGRIYSWMHAA